MPDLTVMTDTDRESHGLELSRTLAALGAQVHGWAAVYDENGEICHWEEAPNVISAYPGQYDPATEVDQALDVLRAMPSYQKWAVNDALTGGPHAVGRYLVAFFELTNEQKALDIMLAVEAVMGRGKGD